MSEVRRERDQAVTIPDPESRHSALAIILCRLRVVSIQHYSLFGGDDGQDEEVSEKSNGRRSGKIRAWSKSDHRELRRHSKAKTRVSVISRATKRTVGALLDKLRSSASVWDTDASELPYNPIFYSEHCPCG